ncbi:hypothetical protein EXS65_04095 [Candidatus Peribacteria bacterium]|nr:hypothetical protein [Candidatus Peribacteria bacterium]
MHLHFILGSFAFSASLLLPASAFAMRSQFFDFGAGQINATWEGKGPIEMKQTPNGVLLHTTGTGLFLTGTDLSVSAQLGSVTISTEKRENIYLVWIYKNDPSQINHNLAIDAGGEMNTVIPFSLSTVSVWNNDPKQIGLILLPNTTVLLHQIRFDELNTGERLWETVRSFWTFDGMRTYSINFLWGPHIADNPVARQDLFAYVPPQTPSGTAVVYVFLILSLLLLAAFAAIRKTNVAKRRAILIGSSLVLALWVLFDLRMGAEFLASMIHDARSYILSSEQSRTFRDRDRFYDFAKFAKLYVSDRESYVFLAEQQWPYLGNMRYLTYPAIPGIAYDTDDTWIIYHRSDVGINDAGQLTIDAQPVTNAGKILGRFDDTSFVFRTFDTPVTDQQTQ